MLHLYKTDKELTYDDYKPLPDLKILDLVSIKILERNIKQAYNNATLYHSELLEMALYDDIQTVEKEINKRGIKQ